MDRAFIEKLNTWGQEKVPFLFVIDFERQQPHAWKLSDVDPDEVLFDFNSATNSPSSAATFRILNISPEPLESYKTRFEIVNRHLERGDSFLINLTTKTQIDIEGDLKTCFHVSNARYRLWLRNRFVVFSPEIFVQTRGDRIFSFPMKGTIDASIPGAKEKILGDEKELAEHVTMIDLIRNDLSTVAAKVRVNRFRYVEEVRSRERSLLQVSSEIEGTIDKFFLDRLGDLLDRLLPAGSISGAPKAKTCEIIQKVEDEPRGYYTGVCGIFDGSNLDSGVMIRFIEETPSGFYYRSGGGITNQSDLRKEYEEVLTKIYVPID